MQPLGARTCGTCGAKVREDRVRCLRCGADLRAEGGAAPTAPSRILWLPAVIVGYYIYKGATDDDFQLGNLEPASRSASGVSW